VIFLHPLALLGLVAAAIPALLHLFERRTPPEAEFPPLRYLTEAERRSARRLRLRHLLLLVLRTALIVAIILAAARPLVPTKRPGGGHPPTALVVILDNSLSSAAVAGGHVTLDRLKTAARTVLQRAAAGDRVWLVLADGIVRAGTPEDLVAAVDSTSADARRLDLGAAVSRAARVVAGEPATVREVHIVSDLQRTALGAGRVEPPAGVRVLALAPAGPGGAPENRGIASARVADASVAVAISGTARAGPVPVTLRIRGRDVARALASPGAAVTLSLTDATPGWRVGEVGLEPDELRADDRRIVVWHVVRPAGVRASATAGPFVTAALSVLRAARRVTDGADVTVGERPGAGAAIVLPPADPALVGEFNRALAARGLAWRFGGLGTPGPLTSASVMSLEGVAVTRRLQLTGSDSAAVLARVNGEPWAVAVGGVVLLGSRLDTTWTALPATPAFVPFLDALVNRFVRGEAPVVEREGALRVAFTTVGRDTVSATVFGPDARESDLTPADPDLIRAALGADVLASDEFAAAAFAGTSRADVSGLLLLFALLLAFAELAVATLTR
jgi:hypothetical protein